MSRAPRPTTYRPQPSTMTAALAEHVGYDEVYAAAVPLARRPELAGTFALGAFLTEAEVMA